MASDGGRAALGGFLYQLEGSAAFVALADAREDGADRGGADVLVKLIRQGELSQEQFGQDAVVRSLSLDQGAQCALVQFKVTNQNPPRALSQADFKEIVARLAASARDALKAGCEGTSHFLVTNRPPTQELATAWAWFGAARSENGAQATKEIPPDMPNGWTADEQNVLRTLVLVGDQHIASWESEFSAFAARYGSIPSEIPDGLDRLIGTLIRGTQPGGDPRVRADLLRECFTHSSAARPLNVNDVAPLAQADVDQFKNKITVVGRPAGRPELLRELSEAVTRAALVVVHGNGGVGKSVVLWQWAIANVAPPPTERTFTVLAAAIHVQADWIKQILLRWAGLESESSHPRRNEAPEVAVERLERANPGLGHPILHLGLDGIDEDGGASVGREEVNRTLHWFWELEQRVRQTGDPPRATLVVTCRNFADVERRVRPNVTGFRDPSGTAGLTHLQIDDFTPDELLDAAEGAGSSIHIELSQLVSSSRAAFGTAGGALETVATREQKIGVAGVSIAQPWLVASLLHPAMWRAFVSLPEDLQVAAAGQQTTGLNALAGAFIDWFVEKAIMRRAGEDDREIRRILYFVARAVGDFERRQNRNNGWLTPATHAGAGEQSAMRLLREAYASGLAIDEGPDWRWRHPFVGAFAAAQESWL